MNMKHTIICIATMLLLAACGGKKEQNDIHFFVAGHTCGADNDTTVGMYEPFHTFLGTLSDDASIDFAVLTGDIVYDGNTDDWNAVDAILKAQKYPFYFAPGNQELKNPANYKARYGNTSRHFEKGNNLFLIWEVVGNGWNVSADQLEEFRLLSNKKSYDNIFIFTHEVIWYDQLKTPQIIPNSIDGKASYLDFYQKTLPVLSSKKTPVYLFAGDVGARAVGSELTIHSFKNMRMIASGMGGGAWDNVIDVQVKDGKTALEIRYLNGRKSLKLDKGFIHVYP